MGPIGWQETVLIFIVALMLFGPKELPKIGKTVAKALSDFKRASSELKDTWQRELTELERETQDIRTEITKETDQISQTTPSYGESYYNQDSSYDYGAYGYPAATTADTTLPGTEPAMADPAELPPGEVSLGSEAPAPVEGPVEGPAPESVPATNEQTPPVTPAHGTVSTHPSVPAVPPADPPTRDEASSL